MQIKGSHVKLLRREWGISQGELAWGIGVSLRTVQSWEGRPETDIAHGYALLLRHALNCVRFRGQIVRRGKWMIKLRTRKGRRLGGKAKRRRVEAKEIPN